jgi:ATP-dependent DNA helicase RecG
MTAQGLKLLIAQGEGYNLEFKQSIPSKASELAEEICAFANAAGGVLLIGVDDNGKIRGITMDNSRRSRLQQILNCIEPHIEVICKEISIDRTTVLYIECKSGKEKPYTVSGNIIVRNGPNSEKITSVQRMRDFFQQSDKIFFDETPCKKFVYPDDFDDSAFQYFLDASGIQNTLPRQIILENLQLSQEKGQFKNGAVLFFASDPQKFHEHAITRCLLFKGTTKTIILDDKIFSGNLIQQYTNTLAYLHQKLNLNYIIKGDGPRTEALEIPEEVFREALVNALCHRDYYEKGAVTHVEIFDDRVEISNPGGLVNSIAREEFGKKSLSRNPLVFGLFQRMALVEKVGSGISRIREEMNKAGLPAPTFSLEGIFTAKFYRPLNFERFAGTFWSSFITNAQLDILREINLNNKISKRELSGYVKLSKTAIDNNINKLKDMGLLERTGSDRGGRWKIIFKAAGG